MVFFITQIVIILLITNLFLIESNQLCVSQLTITESSGQGQRGNDTAKWTVMVYMAADNNLEYFGAQDLNELEMIGSNDDINILVQFDRHPDSNVNNGYTNSNDDWTDTRRFHVQNDEDNIKFYDYTENEDMWILGERNMASPKTFENFLHWSLGNFSAEHYLLILWDHGEGIFSDGRGGGENSNFENSRTRGICNDETDGGWLDLWEMRNVFIDIKSQYNVKFDIIGFDICWIGTVETAYELMDFADYFTASPEEEPNPGWNYRRPISYLAENPEVDPAQIAIKITTEFKEEYKAEKYTEWKYLTYTAIDLNKFKTHFIPLLNQFAETMSTSIFDNYNVINNARSNTMYPHRKGYMRDIFGFAQLIENDKNADPDLRAAAAALNDEYTNIVLKYVHGSLQPKGLGPTIYFPSNDYFSEYNSKLDFASEHWDEFIKLFLTPIQIEHTPLNDTEASENSYIETEALVKGFSIDENNIYLFYLDNKSDTKIPVQMLPSVSGIEHEYSAKIKVLNYDSTIYYYIRCQESAMTTAYVYDPQELDINDESSWYSFKVGVDTTPPIITHDTSNDINGALGEPYTFFANITDNLGIDQSRLFLYYNTNNSDQYLQNVLKSNEYPIQYQYTIPPQPKGTMIYYYFSATDRAKNNNTARLPEQGNFEFNVSRLKPEASFNVSKVTANTFEAIEFTSTSKPEGSITTYLWDFGDKTDPVNGKTVVHKFVESNIYTVTLKVIDENGLWSTAKFDVTIKNSPPIAEIKTGPILVNSEERFLDDDLYITGIIYEDDNITLDCTGSTDLDGYIQTWSWQFGDGNKYTELWTDWNGDGRFDMNDDKVIVQTEMSPTALRERLNTTKTGKVSYNFDAAGDYKIRFSAIDNEALVSEVQYLNVNVENKNPEPRPGYIEIVDLTVVFTPDNNGKNEIDTPSDMKSLNYTWDFGDDQVSYLPNPNHTYSKEAKYHVTLMVRDNDGVVTSEWFELDLTDDSIESIDMLAIYAGVCTIIIILLVIIIIGIFLRTAKPERSISGPEKNSDDISEININKLKRKRVHSLTKPPNRIDFVSSNKNIDIDKHRYQENLKVKELMSKIQSKK